MMARSKCSKSKAGYIDASPYRQLDKPLATHGRTIHSGHLRHFDRRPMTSGLPSETDIAIPGRHVSNVPTTEVIQLMRPKKPPEGRWSLSPLKGITWKQLYQPPATKRTSSRSEPMSLVNIELHRAVVTHLQ
jgi:hypothetical protein